MVSILARIRIPMGFCLAGLYFYMAKPTWPTLPFGLALAFFGILFRAWATGNIHKDNQLAIGGPYTLSRHPLYLGTFVIGLGFCLAGSNLLILLFFVTFFFCLYIPVMKAEEKHLKKLFNQEYENYKKSVPFFIPSKWPSNKIISTFQLGRYLKNKEYKVLLGFIISFGLLILKMYLPILCYFIFHIDKYQQL